MKKMYFEQILGFLNGLGEMTEEVRSNLISEVEKEINKGAAEKVARAAEYEAIHALIVDNLTDTPVTVADLFAEIEGELPEGMNRYKVQYALNNLWQDEIVKIAGKPNTYRRA